MYRQSMFCIPVEDAGSMLVYQTLTSSLIKVSPEFYHSVFETGTLPDDPQQVEALVSMGYLVDEDEDEYFRLQLVRRGYLYADKGITGAVIAVTTDCNARCAYCYENGIRRHAMRPDVADAIVDFLVKNAKSGKVVIQWFGGEPLLAVPVIDHICAGVKAAGVQVSGLITTNGYLIDDEILDKAKNDWNIRRFQIPVDALGRDYDRIKNYIEPDSGGTPFDHVISNIHKVLDAGFHVNARTNFDPDNVEPTKRVLRFLAKEFQEEERFFAYPEPITGMKMSSVVDYDMTGKKIHPYLELMEEMRRLHFLYPTLLKEDDYLEGSESLSGIKLSSRPTGCYATLLSTFAIDPEGLLYKCHRLVGRGPEFSCGDVFRGLSHNKILKEFCSDIPCYEKCFQCALLPLCQGGCHMKKRLYGGNNGCLAIKDIVKDVIRVYAHEHV